MKTKILIAGIVLIAGTLARSATNDLVSALQRGLFEEEANHNLEAAAQAYQAVSTQFDKDRKLAATAIFRLGEVYRKQGKTNEATAQYERIVREFSDQQTLVTLSRQNLAGLGEKKEPPISSALTRTARLEQKKLLDEEIKLVEQDLADAKKLFETGQVSQGELRAKEREVLKLRQQVAALIVDLEDSSAGTSAVTPVTDDEEKEIHRIQGMIRNSPDLIEAKDQARGATPLHSAAALGQLRVAEFLLASGADVEAKDRMWNGATPMHYAADAGHKGMIELLLTRKANVNAMTANGETPLHLAARKGFKSIVELLLASGANVNAKLDDRATPLHVAAVNGFKNVAETLLKAKADPNVVTTHPIAPASGGGSSRGAPIHIAINRGDRALWELLLAHGADVNLKDSSGRTPLREAVENDQITAFETLLAKNADVTIADQDGTTPLLVAVNRQKPELVKILLEHRADPEAAGKVTRRPPGYSSDYYGGVYPLQLAIEKGNLEMLKLLLDRGVDVNAERKLPGANFAPPIWSALSLAKTNVLKLLLQFKPDLNVADANGKTPLIQAFNYPVRKEMVQMLVAAGADVKPADNNGWTALHFAVGYGEQDLAALILNKGADPNALNKDRQTPLDLAKAHRGQRTPPPSPGSTTPPVQWEEIVALLKQHGALDDLPAFDRIQVRRPGFSAIAFQISTNGWNEFSLLELLAVHYGFLSTEQNAVWDAGKSTLPSVFWGKAACQFPDFARVVIRRPDRSGPRWAEIPVNAAALLDSGDCARDVKLQPGDLVEIPEADHPVNEKWAGLPAPQLSNLLHCVSRTITISIKGTPTAIPMSPAFEPTRGLGPYGEQMSALTKGSFMLKSVLAQSRLLRASSDMTRVKVTRPLGDKTQEWVLNCGSGSDPDLWLRDGDVVEVPDKL